VKLDQSPRFSSVKNLWDSYKKERMGVAGLIIIVGCVVIALTSQYVAPYPPQALSFTPFLQPSQQHILGTDSLGRDVFSRVIWGTRVSLVFGVVVAGLSLAAGVVLGALAGYYGGPIDDILSRIFELVLMIPSIFLIILVVAMYGSNVVNAMLIVAFTQWPWNARITRAQVLALKTRTYVQAALVSGVGHLRILFRHILPNGVQPVVTNAAGQMAYAVLVEASLSFLGLGDPNQISWGQMLRLAQSNPLREPWTIFSAGAAIFLLILGFNFFAIGVNFALNPRYSERKA
jgi:peptide/nickel transport system permease protein